MFISGGGKTTKFLKCKQKKYDCLNLKEIYNPCNSIFPYLTIIIQQEVGNCQCTEKKQL